MRRFRCQNTGCLQTTFAEQIPQVTRRHARRTILAGSMLAQIALVLAGRAGAGLASGMGLPVERDTMVRMVRRLPDLSASLWPYADAVVSSGGEFRPDALHRALGPLVASILDRCPKLTRQAGRR